MDRAIVERAVRALAALNTGRGDETRSVSAPVRAPVAQPKSKSGEIAECGSPGCAGCYDVGDGRKIHPPKCGTGFLRWRAWLEGKGQRQ